LMDGELAALLAPEHLTTSQKSGFRRAFRSAKSITDNSAQERVIEEVYRRYEALYGVSRATLQAIVGPECDSVRRDAKPARMNPRVRVASPPPEPGQVVQVRGSTWAVANVQTQGLPRSPADETVAQLNHVVDLQSLDEDRLGEQLSVIWELEVGHTVT